MSEFKEGDKVTHVMPDFPGEYDVIRQSGNLVSVEGANGAQYVFGVKNLTLVDEPPKVGDRVRLVHEGVVTGTSGRDSGSALMIDGSARILGRGETVEILERAPEPYPVGTAVVFTYPVGTAAVANGALGAFPLLRDREGWRNHAGSLVDNVTDKRVRAGEFKVIYEPAKRG